MVHGGLDRRLVVCEGQERVLAQLLAVAGGVDLDVAPHHVDGVAVDGVIEAFDQAVVHHHHRQAHPDGQDNDERSAAVPPDVAPCQAQV